MADAVTEAIDALRGTVAVGQVYEHVPMLCRDGHRFKWSGFDSRGDHTRIRITQVPGGRARTIRYAKVDPRPMGNGRPDRGTHAITLNGLARNYIRVADKDSSEPLTPGS